MRKSTHPTLKSFLFLIVIILAAISAETVAAEQAPDRSKAPAVDSPPALKLPPIQKRTLTNGIAVSIVEMHKVPVVDVMLIVRSGTAADPQGKFGLANLTADMLDEGAGSRSALELADAIDFLGASISTGSSTDSSTVRLHSTVAKLDAALPLMADVALRPSFAQTELDRVKKLRLSAFVQARDNPASIVAAAFPRVVYGPSHRYGTAAGGTESSISSMIVADLKSFHSTFYQPANAHLLVVGDVTPASVLPKLEKAFGSWKNGTTPVPKVTLPQATQHPQRQIYLVDKPGAAQSQIRIGWIGVARSTPDYFVIEVLNTILGGSFTSRLNSNLREQHGYAYGASSGFAMPATPGPFQASAAVQTDKTAESLQEFFKEFDGIRKPVPADELNKARNNVALGFPGTFETTGSMAGHMQEMIVYNLPETYFTGYVSRVQDVTSADLQRAAQQYIQPDKFAVVVVGDLSKIEKPIRDLNLAPIKTLTLDELFK